MEINAQQLEWRCPWKPDDDAPCLKQYCECEPSCEVEISVPASLPEYFLCEAELAAPRKYQRCPRCGGRSGLTRRKCTWCGWKFSALQALSTDGSGKLYILTTAALGGDAGGRRVSMPGLPRLVSSAVNVRAADQSDLPEAAALGTEHTGSHRGPLPALRARVDDPFAQVASAVRSAARPTLSFASTTQEANACSHES
jgi:hypothetical protein